MTRASSQPVAVRAGFIPLIDAAPLIAAARAGFAAAEGIDLGLVRESSWATLRDRMAVRHLDVAHMLAPMPIASNLGLTAIPTRIVVPMALGAGGNTVTVSSALWTELHAQSAVTTFDARVAGDALARIVAKRRTDGRARLTIAIVHPYSAHRYQFYYWLAACGVDPACDIDFVVLPPPLMPSALANGDIDAFTAGEPWGSVASLDGVGQILTTNVNIWRASPEKVLGVREAWANEDRQRVVRLVRAIHAAALWCDDPANRDALAAMLSTPDVLAMPAGAIRRSLDRRLPTPAGELPAGHGFLEFAASAGTVPSISSALFLYGQMIRWGDARFSEAGRAIVRETYRPDFFRAASSAIELRHDHPAKGADELLDAALFFDHVGFDPATLR